VLLPLGFLLVTAYLTVYTVPEGHVGVVFFAGALQPGTNEPGWHVKAPFVTTAAMVDVRLQTDLVQDIPCGTSGGVVIYFDKIEVVNRLAKSHAWTTIKNYGVDYDRTWVFDKIHHEINQFCSSHSLQEVYIEKFDILDEALTKALQTDCDKYNVGLTIVAARVTKPRIPQKIRENYEQMEEKVTMLRVAAEEAKVLEKEEHIKAMKARIGAEREKEVAQIQAAREAEVARINADRELSVSQTRVLQKIAEKEAADTIADMENEMHLHHERAKADAKAYTIAREAEATSLKLTPQYLQYVLYQALGNDEKIFYGESLRQIFDGWAELESLESKLSSD